MGSGEAPKGLKGGKTDLTYTGAIWSGPSSLRGGWGYASRY